MKKKAEYEMERGTAIERVPIDKIKPDPKNPRREFDEEQLKVLAESYKRHGQIQPVELDGDNTIVCGEMRWRICKLAGFTHVDCIRVKRLPKNERLERQFVENQARMSMTAKDQLAVVKQVWEQVKEDNLRSSPQLTNNHKNAPKDGITGDKGLREVARRLGVSERWVRELLKVDEMIPQIKEAVLDGDISVRAANEIHNKCDSAKEMREVLEVAVENEWGKDSVVNYIEGQKPYEEDEEPLFKGTKSFAELDKNLEMLYNGMKVFKSAGKYEELTPLEAKPMAMMSMDLLEATAIHADELMKRFGKRLDVDEVSKRLRKVIK